MLDAHCETEGRDPAEIARTIIAGTDGVTDPDGFRRELESYAGLGISMVWVGPPPRADDPVGWLTELTERRLPELVDL